MLLQEVDLIPRKIEITIVSVFGKIAHLLSCAALELASAHYFCAPHCFLPKHRQDVASQPLRIDEREREVLLVDEATHVFCMRSPSACKDVTNEELSDETFALAGSCNGYVRQNVSKLSR